MFPDVPVSRKPAEVRMGSGKGSPEFWVVRINPGRILFEIDGVPKNIAEEAFVLAAAKLPIKTRIVTRLGDVRHIDTKVIEKLFTADLAYLQNLYRHINDVEAPKLHTACPKCDHEFEVEVDFLSVTEGLS